MPAVRPDPSSRLESALAFLAAEQRQNGEFPTFMARDPSLIRERRFDSTPFATTYVLHALSYVEEAGIQALTARGLDFLEAEMERHGVWRYWTSQNPQHDSIPPDLDDTCCASAVLRRFGRSVPENEELILANRNPSGLFYTWLLPRPGRRRPRGYWSVALRGAPITYRRLSFWRLTEARPWDVDCVVNANVLHHLGARPEARPVVDFLARALASGRAGSCDKWHLSACAFYYAVSRASAGGVEALEPLAEPLAAAAETALARDGELAAAEVALAACALLNLGRRGDALAAAVERLAQLQRADGAWPGFALYWGGPKRRIGWGSEALTTALCVEVLARSVNEPA